MYTVKAVAELAGISVRALHHYDEIGLLRPAEVSPAGYRLYADSDLERLQQILFFRELDFSLQEIKRILESPGFDRRQALLTHRQLLIEKQSRLQALVESIDQSMQAMEGGMTMNKEEMFEPFDRAKAEQYREEARAKYGKEIVDESYRRVSKYSKGDWDAVQSEINEINQCVAAHLEGDPADPEVQAAVERWFRLINERFYSCSLEIFRGLGDLYVGDERFTAFYDKVKPGLAPFLRKAMHIFCDIQTAK